MEHVLSTKDHFTGIITSDYSDISPVMEREDGKFYLVAYTSYVLKVIDYCCQNSSGGGHSW